MHSKIKDEETEERLQRFEQLLDLIKNYHRTPEEIRFYDRAKKQTREQIERKFRNNPRSARYKFPLRSGEQDPESDEFDSLAVYNLYSQNPQLVQPYSKAFADMRGRAQAQSMDGKALKQSIRTLQGLELKAKEAKSLAAIRKKDMLPSLSKEVIRQQPLRLITLAPNSIRIQNTSRQNSGSKRLRTQLDRPEDKSQLLEKGTKFSIKNAVRHNFFRE